METTQATLQTTAPAQPPAAAGQPPAQFDTAATQFATSPDPAQDIAAAALKNIFGSQPGEYQPPIQAPAPQPPAPPQPQPDITARYSDPEPPQPATVPDVPPEQNIQLPENSPESVGRAFAASRAEARQFRQMAESLRQKLADAESVRGDADKRVAELNAELVKERDRAKGLEDELGRLDLTKSDGFREKFDVPLQNIEAQVYDAMVSAGVAQNEAGPAARQVVMAQTLAEVEDIVQNLPDVVKGQIAYKFTEADKLWAARQQAIDEWRETSAGLEAASTRDLAAAAAKRRAELADGAMGRLATTVAPTVWNDPEFAAYRAENEAKAKAWLGQAPEQQVAAAALEGMLVAPYAYKLVDGLMAEVMNLRSALDATRRAGNPTVSPVFVSPPVPPAPPARPPVPTTQTGNSVVTPVDGSTASPVDIASGFVSKALQGMFR